MKHKIIDDVTDISSPDPAKRPYLFDIHPNYANYIISNCSVHDNPIFRKRKGDTNDEYLFFHVTNFLCKMIFTENSRQNADVSLRIYRPVWNISTFPIRWASRRDFWALADPKRRLRRLKAGLQYIGKIFFFIFLWKLPL